MADRKVDSLAGPGSFADRLRRWRKATEEGRLEDRHKIFEENDRKKKKKNRQELIDVLENGGP